MKKIFTSLLALILLAGLLSASVAATATESAKPFTGEEAEQTAEKKTETEVPAAAGDAGTKAVPGAAARKLAENMRKRAESVTTVAKKRAGTDVGKAAKTLAVRLRQVALVADAFASLQEEPDAAKEDRCAARLELIDCLRRAAKAADAFAEAQEAAAPAETTGTPGAAARKLAETLRKRAESLAPKQTKTEDPAA